MQIIQAPTILFSLTIFGFFQYYCHIRTCLFCRLWLHSITPTKHRVHLPTSYRFINPWCNSHSILRYFYSGWKKRWMDDWFDFCSLNYWSICMVYVCVLCVDITASFSFASDARLQSTGGHMKISYRHWWSISRLFIYLNRTFIENRLAVLCRNTNRWWENTYSGFLGCTK